MPNLILYTTEDGKSQVQLRAEGNTVWLTQLEIAKPFSPEFCYCHSRKAGIF